MHERSDVSMWIGLALVVIGLAVALMAIRPAKGATVACASHETVKQSLAEGHREQRVATGLTASGQVLELFVSAQRTWTLTLSLANGETCLIADGDNFEVEFIEPAPGKEKSGS